MDNCTSEFLYSLLSNVAGGLSTQAITTLIKKLISRNPKLQNISYPTSSIDELIETLDEIKHTLEVLANEGEIEINQAIIIALKKAKFDHNNGTIFIANTEISSPTIQIGGSQACKGNTTISGNTELRTSGTSIKLSGGATITITGNASIKQT